MLKGACMARSGQRCKLNWFLAPGLLKMLMAVSFSTCIWSGGQLGETSALQLEGDGRQASTKIQKGKCGASVTDIHPVFLAVNGI